MTLPVHTQSKIELDLTRLWVTTSNNNLQQLCGVSEPGIGWTKMSLMKAKSACNREKCIACLFVCFLIQQIQRKYIKLQHTHMEKKWIITSKVMMYVRIAHKSLGTYAGLFPMLIVIIHVVTHGSHRCQSHGVYTDQPV